MKKITTLLQCLLILLSLITGISKAAMAQDSVKHNLLHISLKEAIERAQEQNKWIAINKVQEKAGASDLKAAKKDQYPHVNLGTEYDRFSKLTLYNNGLSESHSITRLPDPNTVNAGAAADFTLFEGGRRRALVETEKFKNDIDAINTNDQTGNIKLQVVSQYMDIIRLIKLDSILSEQINRADVRLKNIRSLYENQKVTKSDLLRAEVNLSDYKLRKEETENDLHIANDKMNVLLNFTEPTTLLPTDNLAEAMIEDNNAALENALQQSNSYVLQRFSKSIQIQETQIKIARSNYYPSIQMNAGYGLNYPNQLFNPPVAQWYSVGFVGIKVRYDLTSFFHNKDRVAAAAYKLKGMQIQQDAIADNIHQEQHALMIKYNESLSRIKVAKDNIEQALANLKIINTKYLNQLALLTDLLDADDLYLSSTYNLVKARTDERIYYYKLLYSTGKL